MGPCPSCGKRVYEVTMPGDPRRVYLCTTLACPVGHLLGTANPLFWPVTT